MIDAVLGRLRPRRLPSGRRRRRRGLVAKAFAIRLSPFATAMTVLALGIAAGGWLWFRSSSFVAVKRIQITGVSGPGAAQIRAALWSAAAGMTTLDVSVTQLRSAVRSYPDVKTISVSTSFPHGLRISVVEQIPVGQIEVPGESPVAVSGNGILLHASHAADLSLPVIVLSVPPSGPRLTAPGARAVVSVLAAAPYQLLPRIAQADETAAHGVVARLRNGPSVYFGSATDLRAKWDAAVAVLGDSGSAGAQYIDVTDPERAAAGASTSTTTPGAG
jgi:cell division protein FtsQ